MKTLTKLAQPKTLANGLIKDLDVQVSAKGKTCRIYNAWFKRMENSTHKGGKTELCEEWLTQSNFYAWYVPLATKASESGLEKPYIESDLCVLLGQTDKPQYSPEHSFVGTAQLNQIIASLSGAYGINEDTGLCGVSICDYYKTPRYQIKIINEKGKRNTKLFKCIKEAQRALLLNQKERVESDLEKHRELFEAQGTHIFDLLDYIDQRIAQL